MSGFGRSRIRRNCGYMVLAGVFNLFARVASFPQEWHLSRNFGSNFFPEAYF